MKIAPSNGKAIDTPTNIILVSLNFENIGKLSIKLSVNPAYFIDRIAAKIVKANNGHFRLSLDANNAMMNNAAKKAPK